MEKQDPSSVDPSSVVKYLRLAVWTAERILGAEEVEFCGGVEVAFGAHWIVRCGDWEGRGDTLGDALRELQAHVTRMRGAR